MADSEADKFAETVFQSVRVYVQAFTTKAISEACAPLLERIANFEKAMADAPKPLGAQDVLTIVGDAGPEVVFLPKGAEILAKMVREEVGRTEGYTGPRGEPGEKGEPGADGKDAVVDEAMIAAALEKAVAAIEIVVPPAEPGPAGKDGADGKDGKDAVVDYAAITKDLTDAFRGICGMLVEDAIKDEQIPELVAKAVAEIPKPADGRDGRDAKGDPGRDAAELVVLSAIDPERIYAMGTWARHCGGLWQAKRDTDELKDKAATDAGWACIVEGFAKLSLDDSSEDGRTITVAAELSSGRKSVHTIQTAAMLYRGIYEPGKEYAKGDVVSFAGSALVAQRATKAMPETPGAGDDWKLIVKRGRDGKDAEGKSVGKREPVRL